MAFMFSVGGPSYQDAVRLLGQDEPKIAKFIDRLSGAALVSASVGTVAALAFFDVRDEAVSWGNDVIRSIRDRVSGLSRFDRTQRLMAAHTVVVITSFYDALAEVTNGPGACLKLSDLELTSAERIAIMSRDVQGVIQAPLRGYGQMVESLLYLAVVMPEPQSPYERTVKEVAALYADTSGRLRNFLGGLACWEQLSETDRDRSGRLLDSLPETAARRYEENYRRLAAEVPEFAVWTNLTEHQATRGTIERIGGELLSRLEDLTTGLAGVSELMREMAGRAAVERTRHDLVTLYQRGIDASILSGADAPEGVVLPSLAAAYVNPRCRVRDAGRNARLADESWWADFGVVGGVQQLIPGLITKPRAIVSPLVVLGHPGAGKSVLTKVLAARLADTDLLPVRVELRSVPADASIQEQIEHAVRDLTGRGITWPDFVESADGALPVVMLDGFDELLQATGVNQSGYLEEVAQFQLREYELGRPVAVIVTSRTVVVDRARIPSASVVLKLEPFDEVEVETWLAVWNESNDATFAARGIRPFPLETALAHSELANQPLLLMMLALYDAGDNGLQNASDNLSRAELYEQLFADFARREVRKHHPNADDDEERREIETELRRLAVVALAMFNRRAQVVTESDLNKDLGILLERPARPATTGLANPLGAAQLVVGRFFFVHESRALRDGRKEHAFEFLHATFGEFLVARIVVTTLRELVEERAFNNRRTTPTRLDDSFLWAALSFAALVRSAAIVDFIMGLLHRLATDERAAIDDLASDLLRYALYSQPTRSFADYEPMPIAVSARHAAFSCNLAVLTVLSADGPVPTDMWNTSLWWSELSAHEWNGLRDTVRIERRLDPDRPQTELWARWEDGSPIRPYDEDSSSTLDDQLGSLSSNHEHFTDLELPANSEAGKSLRTAAFFRNSLEGPRGLSSILLPYYRYVDAGGTASYRTFHMLVMPPANIFLELRLAPFHVHGQELRVQLYHWCFGALGRPRGGSTGRVMLLRQLREDARHMDPQVVIDLLVDNRVPYRNAELTAALDVLEIVGKPNYQAENIPSRVIDHLVKAGMGDGNSGLSILLGRIESLVKQSDDAGGSGDY